MKISKTLSLRIAILIVLILLAISAFWYYQKQISTTKIAFINFSEYKLSRISKSKDNSWIEIESLELNDLDKIRDYATIFIFGRGFQMSPEQKEALENAGYAGANIFVESATNPNMDITNLKGETLDLVSDYFDYGGTDNYHNLLSYVRHNIEGKTWFTRKPDAPIAVPRDVFIHRDENAVFETYEAYQAYLEEKGLFRASQPNIALITSVPGPFNSNRDHIDSLIGMLEGRGLNVYTINTATKRLDFLKQINPDLVILMPHGRLTLGQEKEAIEWLKNKNIPILTPLSLFQPYEEWVDDPQGFAGPLLSMSVVLPEIDGGINPYTIVAQYKDETGFLSFQAIPDRLKKFGDMVEKWLSLQTKPNKDKKIAIYYFKGPGLNAMVAANMEVVPSIYNTLVALKKAGYNVDNLPASAEELWKMIQNQGAVLGPYAKGAFDNYLETGNPALVEKSVYEGWVANDLKAESYKAVTQKYGEAPGEYLSTRQEGKEYIAVARLQFGNVVLLPQPLSGLGDNTFKIVHGTKAAPPHPYIASYLWTRNEFKADAIFHFGTHGSLEFTPGKQVALSGYDWTDALIGTTPHFYVYTISNVGEGIIAKRRSYATTLTYLTPPFMESDVTGDLKQLSDKLTSFVGTKGAVREQYRKNIGDLVLQLNLQTDLELDSSGIYDDESIQRISNHVEEIRNAKVTGGLYTIGKTYNSTQINNTALLMAIDPIAYSLASLDKLKGKVTQQQLDDQIFFDQHYRKRAKKAIAQITIQQAASENVLTQLIDNRDLNFAHNWLKRTQGLSDADIIKGFISMGRAKKRAISKDKQGAHMPTEEEVAKLKSLVIAISPFPERVAFIKKLKSDKQFKQSSGILNPKTLQKAKTVAKAVPAMAKALEIGQQPDVMALLKMMQKEPLRQMTFTFLDDESLALQVAEEKKHAQQSTLDTLSKPDFINSLSLVADSSKITYVPASKLYDHLSHLKRYQQFWPLVTSKKPGALSPFWSDNNFEIKLNSTIEKLELSALANERKEETLARAILSVEQAVSSVNSYREALNASTDTEIQAILTGLDGGYIVPSSGGDPITNPATIPTGRNLYSIDAEKTPSPEAWNVGVSLAKKLVDAHLKKHGEYPKKISFTLWPGDFIGTEGAMIGEIFFLLGVEPVRDPFNRVVDIRLIPHSELQRPRIDVVVQTAGQFRDLAASRMYLINKAVKMAADANDITENYVKAGVLAAEIYMKKKGLSPKQAREWSTQRVFGGINGTYGTNIMGMVEKGNSWENESEVANTYLHNMGAIYDEGGNWGAFREGVFEAALQNTEVVVQPRESNTWGALSLDHVYEFMGGLSMAVRTVTGKDPDAYFNDFRNPSQAKVQELKTALWVEARSTLLNPKYIKEYMKGGATSAETFAETFRNTYGWNVMKPNEIDDALWNSLHEVYIEDQLNLDVQDFFRKENPYALEEMTAVMLETIRKGYWKASQQQISELTKLHADLIKDYKAGCSEFVCNNDQLQSFIANNLTDDALADYEAALKAVQEPQSDESAMVLEKESIRKTQQNTPINLPVVLIAVVCIMALLLIVLIIKRKRQD